MTSLPADPSGAVVDTTMPLQGLLPASLRHGQLRFQGEIYPYVECGSGPPLLLIHGWSGSWENFIRWMPLLEPHFRLLVPDLPGCNGAPALVGKHTTAAYAEFLDALLDATGARPAWVGGLCFGANIGMDVAARSPEAVSGLLLHTPLFHPSVTGALFRRQVRVFTHPAVYPAMRRLRFNRLGTRLYSLYKRRMIEGNDVLWEDNLINEKNMRLVDRRAARELALDVLNQDLTGFLRDWRKPIFVIAAENDVFLRFPEFLSIKEFAPDVRLALLAQAGHGWTSEFVRRQEAALRDFVRFALSGAGAA
jgi:pimeloyl-ACP methyl ester carboxylesterase